MNRLDMANQVSVSLGDHDNEFDQEALLLELIHTFGIVDIDTIETVTYWRIVSKHERPTPPVPALPALGIAQATDPTPTHDIPMYPALGIMEKKAQPLRYGHEPYWRAPICPASKHVLIPAWNWRSIHQPAPGQKMLTLDVNGAYMAATGSVIIAHGPLKHTGEWDYLPEPQQVATGYYKITVPYWAFSGTIVSPLGDSARVKESSVWVAHPTLILLLEILEEGGLGDFGITDSWTCATQTNWRAWQARLKAVRIQVLAEREAHHNGAAPTGCDCYPCAKYAAFKEGYSAAFSMMLTGEKCTTSRPDWAHAVFAEHAASSWRKAWRFTGTGRPLLSMGATDEITIIAEDLDQALNRPKPPFRYDPTGRNLGAFKPKAKPTPLPDNRPSVLVVDDDEDIV